MKKITCFQISTVLLLSYSTLAFSATIGFDSGSSEGLIGSGLGLSGTINDGAASTSFNVVLAGGEDTIHFLVNDGAVPATHAAFERNGGMINPNTSGSSKITFGQALNDLVIEKSNPATSVITSDSVQWTISWVTASGSSDSAAFTDNNTTNNTTANVYNPSGSFLGPIFNSGDSFYFDINGTLNEETGSAGNTTSNAVTNAYDFEFELPDEIIELTYTYTYTNAAGGNPLKEALGLSFAGATIVPEPSSTALLGLGLAFPILRRNRKK